MQLQAQSTRTVYADDIAAMFYTDNDNDGQLTSNNCRTWGLSRNSVWWAADPTSSVASQPINLDSGGVLIKKLSTNALEELIQDQSQIIDQQKAHLARLDLAVDNAQQREVHSWKQANEDNGDNERDFLHQSYTK
ncbi:Uncharacterized protein BM_BM9423 [Brugia malayi]|uniref:Bm9423 n=1 Tax=Brugia malayi TaxID=6279 RepID=A0A0J9XRK6_BRUMA|nr:Uncharacterized protein BM_BM9423 [Brugia malayi]CDP93844.1 Bm9423 [Brugia malayi]VIP00147.1 Uncharacterized protein BM_BM9423 [Brugia malayi]